MTGSEKKNDKHILFYCTRQNPDDFPGLFSTVFGSEKVKMVEVPCSGRVGVGEIMQAISADYKKVGVLSCGTKSCVHGFGCIEAKKAMDRARRVAEIAGVDKVRIIFLEADDPAMIESD